MIDNIRTDIGLIDLDDSSIIDIKRSKDEIQVYLDFARFEKQGCSTYKRILMPSLIFQNVYRESAKKFISEGITEKHPDPTQPLDKIEVVEYSTEELVLQGYRNKEPWYVWKVNSKSLSIYWDKVVANAT